jgi:putative transposase
LQYLFAIRGAPGHLRSDNGPEFVAHSVRRWLSQAGVQTLFIAIHNHLNVMSPFR